VRLDLHSEHHVLTLMQCRSACLKARRLMKGLTNITRQTMENELKKKNIGNGQNQIGIMALFNAPQVLKVWFGLHPRSPVKYCMPEFTLAQRVGNEIKGRLKYTRLGDIHQCRSSKVLSVSCDWRQSASLRRPFQVGNPKSVRRSRRAQF
jgi:hypothetical protein